jgi:predicted PolB exonuclease-like 3'-5' exonuclease
MGLNNENAVITPNYGRPWLCFDIETCPMPSCAEYLTDPIKAPSNYKDPVKIAAYVEENRQAQIDQAGLDLDLCEIVAIAMQGSLCSEVVCTTRYENGEREMLEWFWRSAQETTLVGFNCLSFDLPILLRRSLYLNVQTPHVAIDKYRHEGVIDVADVLTYGGKTKWRSLAFYCKRFGIACDTSIDGAEIPQLVADGKWTEIANHAEADVTATAALATRIGLIYSPIDERVEAAI